MSHLTRVPENKRQINTETRVDLTSFFLLEN